MLAKTGTISRTGVKDALSLWSFSPQALFINEAGPLYFQSAHKLTAYLQPQRCLILGCLQCNCLNRPSTKQRCLLIWCSWTDTQKIPCPNSLRTLLPKWNWYHSHIIFQSAPCICKVLSAAHWSTPTPAPGRNSLWKQESLLEKQNLVPFPSFVQILLGGGEKGGFGKRFCFLTKEMQEETASTGSTPSSVLQREELRQLRDDFRRRTENQWY